MNRDELVSLLEARLSYLRDATPKFWLAVIKSPEFGIVDSDRANFLGLSFTVEMVDGGASWIYLPTDESLEFLKKVGRPKSLEGRYCWVAEDKGGWITFVKMVG